MTDLPHPLECKWWAKPNDLIGGWCVMPDDTTPATSTDYEVADFCSKEAAEHIAELHNAWLEAQRA